MIASQNPSPHTLNKPAQLNVRIPPDVRQDLRAIALQHNVSVQDLVFLVLDQWLDDHRHSRGNGLEAR